MKLCLCIVAECPELLTFSEAAKYFRICSYAEAGLCPYLGSNKNAKDKQYVNLFLQGKNINAMLSNSIKQQSHPPKADGFVYRQRQII